MVFATTPGAHAFFVIAMLERIKYFFDVPPTFVEINNNPWWNSVESIRKKGHDFMGFRYEIGDAPNHRSGICATDHFVTDNSGIDLIGNIVGKHSQCL